MSGFAILANTTFSGAGLPAFGEIAVPQNLLYGSRVNSLDNNIDLSDNEYAHTNVLDVGYSTAGVNNGTGDAYIQTSFDSKALNSFTMYATFKVDLNAQTSYNLWPFGNFGGTAVGGIGLYIRSESDPNNAGKLRVIARASITRKRVSDGVFSQVFADLVLQENLTTLPATLGWLVLSIGFDLTTRVWRVRNVITGAVVSIGTTDTDWVLQNFNGADRNADPASVPNHRLMHAGHETLDNNCQITLAEHFVWNRLLTDNEFAEQLGYSRNFMLNARGVTLP